MEKSTQQTTTVVYTPIGFVENKSGDVPRHWSVSSLEGVLAILPRYERGLTDLTPGQRIAVLFHFHRSAPFSETDLRQAKRATGKIKGVFSICSPRRPNAIGMSILDVLAIDGGRIRVRGLDMLDGTPILDIKPYIE
jgi:tRNA-Thr(GGU) m(6)t(6)A37 methyltransferase TsaA